MSWGVKCPHDDVAERDFRALVERRVWVADVATSVQIYRRTGTSRKSSFAGSVIGMNVRGEVPGAFGLFSMGSRRQLGLIDSPDRVLRHRSRAAGNAAGSALTQAAGLQRLHRFFSGLGGSRTFFR